MMANLFGIGNKEVLPSRKLRRREKREGSRVLLDNRQLGGRKKGLECP